MGLSFTIPIDLAMDIGKQLQAQELNAEVAASFYLLVHRAPFA